LRRDARCTYPDPIKFAPTSPLLRFEAEFSDATDYRRNFPDRKLAGIGSLVVSEAKADMPGNMFVPIDRLQPVMDDLLALGRSSTPPRPWLGVNLRELDGELVVGRFAPDGPSDKAGVRHRDQVTAIDGARVRELADFYRTQWRRGEPAGSPALLTTGLLRSSFTRRRRDRV
jgi:hypothetical protein